MSINEKMKSIGPFLRWKCEEVHRKVLDRFRSNNTSPEIAEAELRCLHDKLDCIAGYLSRLVVTEKAGAAHDESRLRVSGPPLALTYMEGEVTWRQKQIPMKQENP